MKLKLLPIKDIKVWENLYPRQMLDWTTAHRYAEAMKAGAEFPNIVVAYLNGEMILVDGYHRLDAHKRLKQEHIQCEVHEGMNERQIYLEAIKRNISHGKRFGSGDRTKIILTLKQWNLSNHQISQIVRIPSEAIEPFVAKRIVRITGQEEPQIIKKPFRAFAGVEFDSFPEQRQLVNSTQTEIINTLIDLIENKLLDLENEKIKKDINVLKELLNKLKL